MSTQIMNKRNFHGVAVDAGSGLEASIREARGTNAASDDLFVFCLLYTSPSPRD